MNGRFQVRRVQQKDFAKWKPLWDGYNAFYGCKGESALPDAITDMTWSRFFDGYEPMHALVAEQGDQLLGLTHFLFPSQYHFGGAGVLSAGSVHG